MVGADKDNDLTMFTKCDIFTPDKTAKLMSSKLTTYGNLLEPAAGKGDLLKFIDISAYDSIDVYELKSEYLKDINLSNITKFNADFLKASIVTQYKNIILNPPYIKVQDLSKEYRKFLKESFACLGTGLVDIYYAFILKCIALLCNDGIMVSITPNAYLYNKSAIKLRKYLVDNRYIREIIDYKSEKVFPGVSVYCCITIFTKEQKEYLLYNGEKIYYSVIDMVDYNIVTVGSGEITNTNVEKTLFNICKITNGIATLRDKIFIHKDKLFAEPCWVPITNGTEYKHIIYPYKNGKVICESDFKKNNPLTYAYLEQSKDELAKRDKGNKTYPEWYSFGRTQSLSISKKKRVIYISVFINPTDFKLHVVEVPTLFHGCLCIEPNNDDDVDLICNSIKQNINFIDALSSKRSGGWINISSRTLYKVPIV
jgi:hypothetical protein